MKFVAPHRIVFDDQIFRMQPYGGISRYVCEVAAALGRMADLRVRILAPLHVNAYLPASAAPHWGWRLPRRFRGEGQLCTLVNRLAMPTLMRMAAPDLVHLTYYPEQGGLPRSRGQRPLTVVTVYDMIHELFPAAFPAGDPTARRKAHAVQAADRVICISDHTAADVMRLLNVPRDRIEVIPLGFSADFGECRATLAQVGADPAVPSTASGSGSSRPYLLYVGARPGHKNFARLLQAYGASPALQAAFDLVAFGGGALTGAELAEARRAGVGADRLHWRGGDDRALAAAYRQAHVFVYPSLYEGFGIPPLEAMSGGCPVVCSNTSSIPEVVGPAGAYFHPENTEDMRMVIEQVAFDPARRRALSAAGVLRCREFSWARCAEATAGVYRALLGPGGAS